MEKRGTAEDEKIQPRLLSLPPCWEGQIPPGWVAGIDQAVKSLVLHRCVRGLLSRPCWDLFKNDSYPWLLTNLRPSLSYHTWELSNILDSSFHPCNLLGKCRKYCNPLNFRQNCLKWQLAGEFLKPVFHNIWTSSEVPRAGMYRQVSSLSVLLQIIDTF